MVSRVRVDDHVRCARRRRSCPGEHRPGWAHLAPIIRDGRLQVSVARGPVHVFEEPDYCWGIGPLALRLTRVEWDRPVPYEGDTWLEVEGLIVDRVSGVIGPRRQVLVRACRLPDAPERRRPRLRRMASA